MIKRDGVYVQTSSGKVFVVDEDDLPLICSFRWTETNNEQAKILFGEFAKLNEVRHEQTRKN